MTPERWALVQRLFHETADMPSDRRNTHLDEVCLNDPTLRADVENMLNADRDSGRRIGSSIDAVASAALVSIDESGPDKSVVGKTVSHFHVIEVLDRGGMGVVYRAEDTRLGRNVALKFLPEDFAYDHAALERFQREARAASALNHPSICAVYDIGEYSRQPFIVMEFLEGETLKERMARAPIAIDEVLDLAIQVAAGLEAAHAKGIIHRDIKPSNIRITREGQAKILDFGIAKLTGRQFGSNAIAASSLTTPGQPMGTAGYMSPEQALGQDPDPRTDIFAFGTVLYEMITGRKAFPGKTQVSVIAAILEREPEPIPTLRTEISPVLDRIVRKCLAKTPADRWQTVADLRNELQWVRESGLALSSTLVSPQTQRKKKRILWALAAVGLMAIVALGISLTRRNPVQAQPIRFSVLPNKLFRPPGSHQIALSPDGRYLAFVANDNGEKLWIRKLDEADAHPVAQTDGASFPFWSPDSRLVGFWVMTESRLKKVALSGGLPETICNTPTSGNLLFADWNRDGTVLFGTATSGLYRVSAAGGKPAPFTHLDRPQGMAHMHPHFLPDGDHFLFLNRSTIPEQHGLYVGSLTSPETKRILANSVRAVYAEPGYILTRLENAIPVARGPLVAYPSSLASLAITGNPITISDEIGRGLGDYLPVTAAGNGIIAFGLPPAGGGRMQMTWYNRSGKSLGTVGDPQIFSQVNLSPDEKRVLLEYRQERGALPKLGLGDLVTGVFQRLSFSPTVDVDGKWAPDGQHMAFASEPNGPFEIFRQTIGSTDVSLFVEAKKDGMYLDDWSPDGKYLITRSASGSTVFLVPTTGDRRPQPVMESPYIKDEFRISPDGHWVAYNSAESGRVEVYIADFPKFTRSRQVSDGGGCQPTWRKDMKELFYLTLDGRMMRVGVHAGQTIQSDSPQLLFPTKLEVNPGIDQYAVTGDGQRFLLLDPIEIEPVPPISVIVNWTAILKK